MEYDSITLPRNSMKLLIASALAYIGELDQKVSLIELGTTILKSLPHNFSEQGHYEIRRDIDVTLAKLLKVWFPEKS